MRQKFFKSNIQSKFIKALLRNSAVPIYDTVSLGDYIVDGYVYVYKCRLIKCTGSGYIGGIIQSGDLVNSATYITLQHIDFKQPYKKQTEYFYSTYDYYDSTSHEWLGKYLRALRDIWDINLMPFYNCYNNQHIDTVYISGNQVYDKSMPKYKIIKVPIKLNKKYTIAIDCASTVQIAPVILNMQHLLNVNNKNLTELLCIENNIKTYPSLSFKQPIVYSVKNTNSSILSGINIQKDKFIQQYERDLYMLIQIPSTNHSSIVVLEGDYTNLSCKNIVDISSMNELSEESINSLFLSDISLLQMNDNNSYPFSDRLIEYLLLNAITYRDEFHHDIETIQDKIDLNYQNRKEYGIWDNVLRYKVWNEFNKNNKYPVLDCIGYIDKDIEKYLLHLAD